MSAFNLICILSFLTLIVAQSRAGPLSEPSNLLASIEDVLSRLNNNDDCELPSLDSLMKAYESYKQLENQSLDLSEDQKLLKETIFDNKWSSFVDRLTQDGLTRVARRRMFLNMMNNYQKSKYGHSICEQLINNKLIDSALNNKQPIEESVVEPTDCSRADADLVDASRPEIAPTHDENLPESEPEKVEEPKPEEEPKTVEEPKLEEESKEEPKVELEVPATVSESVPRVVDVVRSNERVQIPVHFIKTPRSRFDPIRVAKVEEAKREYEEQTGRYSLASNQQEATFEDQSEASRFQPKVYRLAL